MSEAHHRFLLATGQFLGHRVATLDELYRAACRRGTVHDGALAASLRLRDDGELAGLFAAQALLRYADSVTAVETRLRHLFDRSELTSALVAEVVRGAVL